MNIQVVNLDLSVNFHTLILSRAMWSLLLKFLSVVFLDDIHQRV